MEWVFPKTIQLPDIMTNPAMDCSQMLKIFIRPQKTFIGNLCTDPPRSVKEDPST